MLKQCWCYQSSRDYKFAAIYQPLSTFVDNLGYRIYDTILWQILPASIYLSYQDGGFKNIGIQVIQHFLPAKHANLKRIYLR